MCQRCTFHFGCSDVTYDFVYCNRRTIAEKKVGFVPCKYTKHSTYPQAPDRPSAAGVGDHEELFYCCCTDCCQDDINHQIAEVEKAEDKLGIEKRGGNFSERLRDVGDLTESKFNKIKNDYKYKLEHHFEKCLPAHEHGTIFSNQLRRQHGQDPIYPAVLAIPDREDIDDDTKDKWQDNVKRWKKYDSTKAEFENYRDWRFKKVAERSNSWTHPMFFLNSIENLEFRANKSINNPATEKEKVELRDMEQEYRDMTTVLKYAPRDHMWVEENLSKCRIALEKARKAIDRREKRGKVTIYGDVSEESPETSTETTSEVDYVVRTGNMTVSQTGTDTHGGATQQRGGGGGRGRGRGRGTDQTFGGAVDAMMGASYDFSQYRGRGGGSASSLGSGGRGGGQTQGSGDQGASASRARSSRPTPPSSKSRPPANITFGGEDSDVPESLLNQGGPVRTGTNTLGMSPSPATSTRGSKQPGSLPKTSGLQSGTTPPQTVSRTSSSSDSFWGSEDQPVRKAVSGKGKYSKSPYSGSNRGQESTRTNRSDDSKESRKGKKGGGGGGLPGVV